MAIYQTGSWLGGYLPDFGITEKLGFTGNYSNPAVKSGGAAFYSPPQPQASQVQGATSSPGNYYPYPVSSYNAPNRSSGGSGTIPTNNIPNNQNAQQTIQQGQDNGNNQIESDYNSAMGMLSNAESGLRSQAGQATGQIEADASAAQNELTNNQTAQQQGVQTSLQQGETQAKSAMQQARDVFRQTQQQNNAQLSALGISSSSVTEALAERLGVETARRIAGVTGSLDEVRQNANNELGRIKTYYSGKMEDLTKQVNLQKSQIQNSLVQGLNQINQSRDQAAQQKAQARAGLLQQVQGQLGQLAQAQQQFEQSLQAWAQQKSAALTPIAQDPNYLNNLMATANTFNQQLSPTGFSYTPEVNVNAQGQYTGKITAQQKPKDPNAGISGVPSTANPQTQNWWEQQ